MIAGSCTRLWQVEAARDGRLVGPDRASFERHLASCEECRAEMKSIESLGERLRALPAPVPDQLATRRRRQQLLAEADRAALAGSSETTSRKHLVWAAVVVAVAAIVVVSVRARSSRAPAPVPTGQAPSTPAEIAAVKPSQGAKWSRRRDADLERITLAEGELSIDVRHAGGTEHVLVTLPDGELEDLGTRFVVAVTRGRTTNVFVHEGLVVLRLDGRAPLRIVAGSSWSAPNEAPVPSACATIAMQPATPPNVVSPMTVPTTKPKPAASTVVPDLPANDFQSAMAHLRTGDNAAAAAAFAAFVSSHPTDGRTEDAAYLRVIALQRAGQHVDARSAAVDYLARFPKGFRRREVEAIAP